MKYLYLVLVLLALAVVGADHYATNTYLDLVNSTQTAQAFRQIDIIAASQAIKFASTTQVIAARQSEEIERLDGALKKAVTSYNGARLELSRAIAGLEKDGEIIKELTDENSKLQEGRDMNEKELEAVTNQLKQLIDEKNQLSVALDIAKKIIEDLKKQLKIK